MEQPDDSPALVGKQLAKRRDDLHLTQDELAKHIGVTTAAVSKAERGINTISRGRRSDWEEALNLQPGTISRAYRDGTPLEPPAEDASLCEDEPEFTEEEIREWAKDPEALLAQVRKEMAESDRKIEWALRILGYQDRAEPPAS